MVTTDNNKANTTKKPHIIPKTTKLDKVCYDIRGPILDAAERMEAAGHDILKLNIGNPSAFGVNAPDEIIRDIRLNLRSAEAYGPSQGLFAARKAIMQDFQLKHIPNVDVEDIYMGNGVSELIQVAVQALLNDGDQILIPAPDYPLWTACTVLAGGDAVHYRCDEQSAWQPDIADLKSKINRHTRAIVVINPNNPTGAVYSLEILKQIVDLARKHNLVLFADEIYEKMIYDGVQHIPLASLAPDVLCVSFNGLSKNYRMAGFRVGWMVLSGERRGAKHYINALNILTRMRLCANMPGQFAVQTALGGKQTINDLVAPLGDLCQRRDTVHALLEALPGVTCVKPSGASYAFPRLSNKFNIKNDEKLVLDFLKHSKVLLVPGSAFNCMDQQHVRIVFFPPVEQLTQAINRLGLFLKKYHQ